jgi:hypothetical protein
MRTHIGDSFMKSIPCRIACATLKDAFLVVAVLVLLASFVHAEVTTQASTLTELIAMFDSSSCKECHEKIYEQWEKSHHARPLMGMDDWIFMASYLKRGPLAIKQGTKATKANFPCFKCHLPQIKHATDEVAAQIAEAILKDDKSTIRKLNISCLVCHNEKAVVHGRPERNVVYGNKDLPDHPGHVVKNSPLLKDSLMCGQCHGLGPNLEFETPVQCATLYGSYLHAYIPSGGTQTCQQCHMKNGDHYMPPDFNKKDELSARLQESLPMEVQTLSYAFQPVEDKMFPMVVVKTKITSKAGHRIPDG